MDSTGRTQKVNLGSRNRTMIAQILSRCAVRNVRGNLGVWRSLSSGQFLKETMQVELAQMETSDPNRPRDLLDPVTRIKLRALQELTAEELCGDRKFSVFLIYTAPREKHTSPTRQRGTLPDRRLSTGDETQRPSTTLLGSTSSVVFLACAF